MCWGAHKVVAQPRRARRKRRKIHFDVTLNGRRNLGRLVPASRRFGCARSAPRKLSRARRLEQQLPRTRMRARKPPLCCRFRPIHRSFMNRMERPAADDKNWPPPVTFSPHCAASRGVGSVGRPAGRPASGERLARRAASLRLTSRGGDDGGAPIHLRPASVRPLPLGRNRSGRSSAGQPGGIVAITTETIAPALCALDIGREWRHWPDVIVQTKSRRHARKCGLSP